MKLPFFKNSPFGSVPEIQSQELYSWLKEKRPVQLVDARTRLEYREGTIGNAAFAPVTEMPAAMERLTLDRSIPVVMLCLSGHRSRPGTSWLRARGYDAYSLKGGIAAWRLSGFPLARPGGAPGVPPKV